MHELGLVQDVVDLVLQRTSGDGDERVTSVRIEVGEFLVASRENLETAFDVLTRGTRLEGSRLEVCEVPGRAVCEGCGFQGNGSDLGEGLSEPPALLCCPTCAAPLVVTSGTGVALVEVVVQGRSASKVRSRDPVPSVGV